MSCYGSVINTPTLAARGKPVVKIGVRPTSYVASSRFSTGSSSSIWRGSSCTSWGTFGAFPGGFWGVHQFHTDSERNLYTADVHVGRPQKFRPKKGANPVHARHCDVDELTDR